MTAQPHPTPAPSPAASDRRLADRGLPFLGIYTTATLLMVIAVAAVDRVGHWWVLLPVMVVLFSLAAGVLVGIMRLLDDDGDEPPA